LFIPALFWPHAQNGDDVPVVPCLRTLLGRSDEQHEVCDDDEAWLCERFGVARQSDWPVAPIALLGTSTPPGESFWLRADPVHLQSNRDQLILLASLSLGVTEAESTSLGVALNHHFVPEQIRFVTPEPQHWYLQATHVPRIHTTSLSRALGQTVDPLLPAGQDRLTWHRLFNEIQMVLHDHPVNEERLKRGALPINSVWFSGGGILPSALASFDQVIGSSALVQGLCKLSNVPFRPVEQGLACVSGENALVELRETDNASLALEPRAWKAALENLEQRWFAPLTQLLRQGHIRRVYIATVTNGRSHQWSLSRNNLLWRWWKRIPPFPALATAG
jgi:hypothetical protein